MVVRVRVNEKDLQLISGCLAGEGAAFEGLYAVHAGRVKAYFLRSGFAMSDSDDLTQETFIRAFKSLQTFDSQRGSFRTWVGAIARNVAIRQWHRRVELELFDPELTEDLFAANSNPDESPETVEEIKAVRAFVEALPPQLGKIIRLRYVEGRTTRGIAEVTGIPESTVRMRLKEAVAMLASWMRSRGFVK